MLEQLVNSQTSPEMIKQDILPGAPWLIAHKSMLGINKPYQFTLNNQDYVMWQNQEGKVFALNNICPHMQAPLSDGFICSQRNTIACPFHVLEFNGEGKLYRNSKLETKAITQPLEVIVEGDLIWTYGGFQPKLPISNLIPRITQDCIFLDSTTTRTISAEFIKCLKINYDFNHAIGTHREPFKIDSITVTNYQANGYYTKLDQKIDRVNNSLGEFLQNPALLTTPKTVINHFEYSFPAITSIVTDTDYGQLIQVFIIYPETDQTTKTFILLYYKPKNLFSKWIISLLKKHFIAAFSLIIEQDAQAVETLYSQQQAKIRLPKEEIMFHAEKLYKQWQYNNA